MSESASPFKPTLEKAWREKIEKEFGRQVLCSSDCKKLRKAIYDKTGRLLGETSVKRMFGFADDPTEIRRSTYDILAMFLGYKSLRDMELDMGDSFGVSSFSAVEEIDVRGLDKDTRIRITYDPMRMVEMTYLGDCRFRVDSCEKSKLEEGDILTLTHLTHGFDLIVLDVERAGYSLGDYHGAKEGGLTSIEIL